MRKGLDVRWGLVWRRSPRPRELLSSGSASLGNPKLRPRPRVPRPGCDPARGGALPLPLAFGGWVPDPRAPGLGPGHGSGTGIEASPPGPAQPNCRRWASASGSRPRADRWPRGGTVVDAVSSPCEQPIPLPHLQCCHASTSGALALPDVALTEGAEPACEWWQGTEPGVCPHGRQPEWNRVPGELGTS